MRPNCSDQKYGTGSYTVLPPSTLAATTSGACKATSQCSKRSLRWYRSDQNDAQSPAAKTPGIEVRRRASTATPLSSSTADPASQDTAGRTPTAVTTTSAATHSLPATAMPPSSMDSTFWPSRRSTPASAYQRAVMAPASDPIAAASGASAASRTVTRQPRLLAAVASSAPIQPAPTMARRVPGMSSVRNASASSMVRSTYCAPG